MNAVIKRSQIQFPMAKNAANKWFTKRMHSHHLNHISYLSFHLVSSCTIHTYSKSIDDVIFKRHISSPMNCWSMFLFEFFILLPPIALTRNFYCLGECSFAVFVCCNNTQTSLLAFPCIVPFPLSSVASVNSTNVAENWVL